MKSNSKTKTKLIGLGAIAMLALSILGFAHEGHDSGKEAPQKTTMNQMQMHPKSPMVDALKNLSGDEFDKAFLMHMIMHHQEAVEMAKLAQQKAKHQEIKDLAAKIIQDQQKEINQLQQWQKQWGYSK